MRRFEHSLIGAGIGVSTAHVLGADPLLSLGLAVFGASIPDLDLHWAPRHYTPRPGSCCKLNEHRGPSHSLSLAIMAGFALGAGTAWWIGLMFTVGWLSHILVDGVSYLGVPYFWPIYSKRIRLLPYGLRVRSGNRLVELPLALIIFALCLQSSGLFHGQLAGF